MSEPDLSLLRDARLVWAMVCDCDCKACQALDVIIQKILDPLQAETRAATSRGCSSTEDAGRPGPSSTSLASASEKT